MSKAYLPEMIDYWNQRYASEGMIWGERPSRSATMAHDRFSREKVTRILVPGAGYGRNAKVFSDHDYRVTGVEIAQTAVKLAARYDPLTTYHHGCVLDTKLEAGGFDAIYCFNLLHLFRADERKQFIQKCFSLLRNDGVIFATVFSEKEKDFGRGNMVESNTFESKPGRPVHYFTEEDLISTFSPFAIIETGIMEDEENHGSPHTHLLRYLYARKASLDFDAPQYKAHSKHAKAWGTKLISELRLTGHKTVLDLGCGDGVISRQIADLVPDGRVVDIDSSRSMINEAKKLEAHNLRFLLMDISDINYHNEFDLIFSNAALHWVKDHDTVLGKCYAALNNRGLIRFNFGSQGNCSHFITVTRQLLASEEFSPYFDGFQWPWYMPGAVEYRNKISCFPYSEIRVWEENADTYFNTADELVGWIDQPSIVPFLKHLAQDYRSSFRDRVVEMMINLTKQPDGRYFETFRRLNILAGK